MAKISSNRGEVVAALSAFAAGFSLRRTGVSKSLGDEVADGVAADTIERTVGRQQDPSGAALAPLAAATIEEKQRHGYPLTITVRKYEMMKEDEVRGVREVSPKSMTMTYGKTERAKLKAEWIQDPSQKRRPQPPREFFGIGSLENPRLEEAAEKGLDAQATSLGAE